MIDLFAQYKGLLFTLAYQLTGSASDAEDIVQDVFVKAHRVDIGQLAEPKAYLCKMVANRCRDLHKSARKRKEQYFGPWLPEPILVTEADPFESVERRSLLTYAMLVLMERLTPAERTVFVLREAFGFEYAGIAGMLEKSETACRKLMSRARTRMGMPLDETVRPEEAGEAWVFRFLEELAGGNVENVVALLAEDVTVVSDGGGKASAAVRPIESRDRVSAFLLGLARKPAPNGAPYRFEALCVNGQTGVVIRSDEGVETVALAHVRDGRLKCLYLLRNPDKLVSFQRTLG